VGCVGDGLLRPVDLTLSRVGGLCIRWGRNH
jgi:hypothetical protein